MFNPKKLSSETARISPFTTLKAKATWNVNTLYAWRMTYTGILEQGGPLQVGKTSLQVPSSRQVKREGPSMLRSDPLHRSSMRSPARYSFLELITYPFMKGSSSRQTISI